MRAKSPVSRFAIRASVSVGVSMFAILAGACSVQTDEGAASSDEAIGRGKLPPGWPTPTPAPTYRPPPAKGPNPTPAPPVPIKLPICFTPDAITSFTAGPVASQPSTIVGEPIHFTWALSANQATGTSIPTTLDGVAVTTTANGNGTATGSYTTPWNFDGSQLTHTLAVGGPCGGATQTITLTSEQVALAPVSTISGSGAYVDGATPTITWQVGGIRPSLVDCLNHTQNVGWVPWGAPAGTALRDLASVGSTGSMVVGPLHEARVYHLHVSCTDYPLPDSTNQDMAQNLMTIQAGTPTIQAFSASPDRVNVNEQTTLHYAASFPHCNSGELVIDGMNEARLEPDFHWAVAATGVVSGDLPVQVPDWTKYTLTAKCRDNAAVATAFATVTAYNPNATSSGTVACFEVECANSPCTVQEVYAADDGQAQQIIDGAYGPQSGCSASSIDCSDALSACPDPFQ